MSHPPKLTAVDAIRGMLAGKLYEDPHGVVWRIHEDYLEMWSRHIGWLRGWLAGPGWRESGLRAEDMEVEPYPTPGKQIAMNQWMAVNRKGRSHQGRYAEEKAR